MNNINKQIIISLIVLITFLVDKSLYGVIGIFDYISLTILLLLMVTSKGMAGVPRASLVVISATLAQFNIPEAGLLLIMGIDQFLDMGRSATNVVGNSIATAVVAKWEGELNTEKIPKPSKAQTIKEIEALRVRLAQLEMENQVLRKISSEDPAI